MKAKTTIRPVSAVKRLSAKLWQLRLYVMDETPKSQTALANLKKICEAHLPGRYRIKVIDLLKHPQLAKGDQILAIPTVVRRLPAPVRTVIGNLSDIDHVLVEDVHPLPSHLKVTANQPKRLTLGSRPSVSALAAIHLSNSSSNSAEAAVARTWMARRIWTSTCRSKESKAPPPSP